MGSIVVCDRCGNGCLLKSSRAKESDEEETDVTESKITHADEAKQTQLIWQMYSQLSRKKTDSWRVRSVTKLVEYDANQVLLDWVLPLIRKIITDGVEEQASFRLDTEWRLVDYSPNLPGLIGYPSEQKMNTENEFQWLFTIEREDCERVIAKLLLCRLRGDVFLSKHRYAHKDKIVFAFVSAVPVKDAVGRTTQVEGKCYALKQQTYNELRIY